MDRSSQTAAELRLHWTAQQVPAPASDSVRKTDRPMLRHCIREGTCDLSWLVNWAITSGGAARSMVLAAVNVTSFMPRSLATPASDFCRRFFNLFDRARVRTNNELWSF